MGNADGIDEALVRTVRLALRQEIQEGLFPLIIRDRPAVRCQFSQEQAGGIMQLLSGVGVASRESTLAQLRKWLKGSSSVTVVDPYFMRGGGGGGAKEQYVADVEDLLRGVSEGRDFSSAAAG